MKFIPYRKISLISFSVIFFLLLAGICPSLCQIANAKSKSHHCCPDQVDQNQEKDCCNQHDSFFDNAIKDHLTKVHFDLVGTIEEIISTNQYLQVSIHSFDENPPGFYQKIPLYLLKQALLH